VSEQLLRIGELASLFGVTTRTIRYYEELGLIEASNRTEGLHRRYPADVLVRLKRIEELKALGLTLGQIREVFLLYSQDPSGEKVAFFLSKSTKSKRKKKRQKLHLRNNTSLSSKKIFAPREQKYLFLLSGRSMYPL